MKKINCVNFVKNNILIIIALLLCLVVEVSKEVWSLNIYVLFILRLASIGFLGLCIFWRPLLRSGILKSAIMVFTPLLALAVVALTTVDMSFADKLAREDRVAEWLSAIFLFIGAISMVVFAAVMIRQKKQWIMIVAALLCALIFFVIGMEEVSWMQRIFGIATPDYLIETNAQKELNFHNMATGFFELAYYFGGFVLLTLLPFFRDKLIVIMNRLKILKPLTAFLPASWLVIPFAVTSAFTSCSTFKGGVYMTIYILTIIIVVATLHRKEIMKDASAMVSMGLSLMTYVVAMVVFIFINYGEHRHWLSSEYRELFIAFGIAVYAIDVTYRSIVENKRRKKIAKA